MKVKTSVSLSAELIAVTDETCTSSGGRSAFLEDAAWDVIRRREREDAAARDREILRRNAETWNEAVEEFIELEADVWDEDR